MRIYCLFMITMVMFYSDICLSSVPQASDIWGGRLSALGALLIDKTGIYRCSPSTYMVSSDPVKKFFGSPENQKDCMNSLSFTSASAGAGAGVVSQEPQVEPVPEEIIRYSEALKNRQLKDSSLLDAALAEHYNNLIRYNNFVSQLSNNSPETQILVTQVLNSPLLRAQIATDDIAKEYQNIADQSSQYKSFQDYIVGAQEKLGNPFGHIPMIGNDLDTLFKKWLGHPYGMIDCIKDLGMPNTIGDKLVAFAGAGIGVSVLHLFSKNDALIPTLGSAAAGGVAAVVAAKLAWSKDRQDRHKLLVNSLIVRINGISQQLDGINTLVHTDTKITEIISHYDASKEEIKSLLNMNDEQAKQAIATRDEAHTNALSKMGDQLSGIEASMQNLQTSQTQQMKLIEQIQKDFTKELNDFFRSIKQTIILNKKEVWELLNDSDNSFNQTMLEIKRRLNQNDQLAFMTFMSTQQSLKLQRLTAEHVGVDAGAIAAISCSSSELQRLYPGNGCPPRLLIEFNTSKHSGAGAGPNESDSSVGDKKDRHQVSFPSTFPLDNTSPDVLRRQATSQIFGRQIGVSSFLNNF